MEISDIRRRLEEHHGSSFGWALSCCRRNRAEAEELLQLVYLKILEGKARYRGESSFKTWLFAVIRRTAANERRKGLLRGLLVARGSKVVSPRLQNVNPLAELEESERLSRFKEALDKLSDRQREILHLVMYQELTLQETAEVIGISIGAVRQHYARAKKRLRELLTYEKNHGLEWRREKNPSAVS
ncbi:MAG TPA: RNA polymerase sigma factor [Pyrinomonadaceae bacterium]|nr:RNA polymerase sigma factor [Pyrinomonadaceae bacterium]